MQTRAGGEHPPGKDALDLALERHLVDFEKGVGVRRLGRRARVAHARGDLQRPELHRFADRRVEGDDAAGDLVESGEHRPSICDLLRRHFGDDRVVRPRCRVCRLGRRRIGRLRRDARALNRRRRLAGGGRRGGRRAGWRRQGLRFGPRRVNAPPETPAPILARKSYRRRLCRERAVGNVGGRARRRVAETWIGPRPVPPQAFRRAWPKGRRYGAWNLTRDRVSARDRVAPVNMPNAANPGISEHRAALGCLTFPASRPCSRRSPWGGAPAPTSSRLGAGRPPCR